LHNLRQRDALQLRMGRGRPFQRSLARLVRGGVASRPPWLATVEKVPPHFAAVEYRKPPRLLYPEDRLRDAYLRACPEARRHPLDLKARRRADAHIADAFVAVQLRAMREQGLSEGEAFEFARGAVAENVERGGRQAKVLEFSMGQEADEGGDARSKAAQVFLASLEDAKKDRELLESLREATRKGGEGEASARIQKGSTS
jgi:hypothetical protein